MSAADIPRDGARRRTLRMLALVGLAGAGLPLRSAPIASCAPWPAWTSFVGRHVQQDGRVVDFATPDQRSTSEGQSYALFFALVNNDQALFERVLGWTRHNLCGDRPDRSLPAWLWGRAGDGSWRVLDGNSASDADLWIAYALLEAGRLWDRPGYVSAGRQLLRLVQAQEVGDIPGLGPMLLPGREGFGDGKRWTFNPSYMPIQLLRYFASIEPKGPWAGIAQRSARLIHDASPVGFAPDWISWDGRAFGVDPAKGNLGSYDAIRIYLWAGMLDPGEARRQPLLDDLSGPVQMLKAQGNFAEKIDTTRGVGSGTTPVGFSAALLPYLSALREPALLKTQAGRIPAATQPAAASLPYYERVLVLFGQGWLERRFRFSADGHLLPAWRSTSCIAKT